MARVERARLAKRGAARSNPVVYSSGSDLSFDGFSASVLLQALRLLICKEIASTKLKFLAVLVQTGHTPTPPAIPPDLTSVGHAENCHNR